MAGIGRESPCTARYLGTIWASGPLGTAVPVLRLSMHLYVRVLTHPSTSFRERKASSDQALNATSSPGKVIQCVIKNLVGFEGLYEDVRVDSPESSTNS